MTITKRLKTIADIVSPCHTVADIGCDHAYLSIYLISNKRAEAVVASDINEGPLEIAKMNIKSCGFEDRILTVKADGLKGIIDKDIDTIVIAGMGGNLMMKILTEGEKAVKKAKEFVFSPQSELEGFRVFLEENGFEIVDEDFVVEDNKYYPIIKAVHGNMKLKDRVFYRYGKIPVERKNPTLYDFLIRERSYLEALIDKLNSNNKSDEVEVRIRQVEDDLKICERALEIIS